MKVWIWEGADPEGDYIMLLVEPAEGKPFGITFNGHPANPFEVAIELGEAKIQDRLIRGYGFTFWRRAA